jgi:hypothetical protein
MKLEGIWCIEMQGPYGWENTATAFLQGGKYRGASANHYTLGTYKVKGDVLVAKAVMTTHGKPGHRRPLFGRYDSTFRITYEGKLKGNKISGRATDTSAKYSVPFRATRLADLK